MKVGRFFRKEKASFKFDSDEIKKVRDDLPKILSNSTLIKF